MAIDRVQVKQLAAMMDLEIPESDLDSVTLRLSALLAAMAQLELELGTEMDAVEPLPPVFPREDY